MLSPDHYRKPASNSVTNNTGEDFSKRSPLVDSIHVNKEKKLLFEKVETEDSYFPFGAPGAGAPLRNANNDLVSKLPNINENLWSRYASEKDPNNLENKRKEIMNLIDTYSTGNTNSSNINDPKYRLNMKTESYWNDWFGRPGAGAPNWTAYKRNLDDMLEPRRVNNFNTNFMYQNEPYVPTAVSLSPPNVKKVYKSNHHNNYEFLPR